MKYVQIPKTLEMSFLICICIIVSISTGNPVTKVIHKVRENITDPNLGWQPEWQCEYLDTLKQVLNEYNDVSNYNKRVEILLNGFDSYWAKVRIPKCTNSQFNMLKAEIQWFSETLMSEELSSDTEKDLLKSQLRDLCNYTTKHLKGQFPFLEESYIQKAKEDMLREFNIEIENPIVPFFRRPFSENQIHIIKTNWARWHERWYFIWRDEKNKNINQESSSNSRSFENHLHYKFIKRCLRHLPRTIPPTLEKKYSYVTKAAEQLNKEINEKNRIYTQIKQSERKLKSLFSNQIEQVEQWSFIFTALLETISDQNDSIFSHANR